MEHAASTIGYRIAVQVIEERGSGRREILWRELATFPPRQAARDHVGQERGAAVDEVLDLAFSITLPEATLGDGGLRDNGNRPYRVLDAGRGRHVFESGEAEE